LGSLGGGLHGLLRHLSRATDSFHVHRLGHSLRRCELRELRATWQPQYL
jgi:hypothetical protein